MSDFSSIPGVGSNKYGTDKIIEGLMKLERVPRDAAQKRVDSFQKEKAVWTQISREASTLRDSAQGLYDSRNPFTERKASSSDEAVLTASATRLASEQTRSIVVRQAAPADVFSSSDLPKDYKVPAGNYAFGVGDKKVELRFAGGGLQDFVDALNRKGRDLLRASVIPITKDSRSLVIESLKTGSSNRLGFATPETEKLALESGMMDRVGSRAQELAVAKPQAWEKPLDANLVTAAEGRLSVATGGEGKLALPSPARTEGLVLDIRYRVVDLPVQPEPQPPPGPAIGPTGRASYKGVSIESAPSEAALPAWEAPPPKPRVDDLSMLSLLGPGGSSPLAPLQDTGEPVELRVELGPLLPELSALGFRNRDTGRRLEILSARVHDPAETGGLKPKRAIASARDALLSLDGVEVRRESNAVDDLIPGVTLNLKDASEKPVKLKVEPDREAVKEALINLVGRYNRLMADINILSRNDPALVEEIAYFTPEEKKTATERLGMLQGDSTLSLVRGRMQSIMISAYPTDAANEMALLSQIGISSNAQTGGGYSASKMRGYLEMDEAKLDAALASRFEAVRQLFGNDTDGDLIRDSGAAVQLDSLLKAYVQTGGIFAGRSANLDRQIASEKRTIESLDVALARKEQELRASYGKMEGALSTMEGTSSSIDQFSKNSSGQ